MILTKYLKAFGIFFFVVLIVLVGAGFKRFVVWPQITDFYAPTIYAKNQSLYCTNTVEQALRIKSGLIKLENVDLNALPTTCDYVEPVFEDQEDHLYNQLTNLSHKVRLALFYPIVHAGIALNLNIHLIFSLFCLGCIFLSSYFLSKLFKPQFQAPALGVYLAFFSTLSVFMNGRFLVSYLSIALLVWALEVKAQEFPSTYKVPKLANKALTIFSLGIFFSFFLSNVSSGMNVVVLGLFVFVSWRKLRRLLIPMWTWICLGLISLFQLFWVISGITKNFRYYGGNVFELLGKVVGHGLGQLARFPFGLPLLVLAAITALFLIIKYRRKFNDTLWLGLLFFSVGGIFGLSVLTGNLIFALTLVLRTSLEREQFSR